MPKNKLIFFASIPNKTFTDGWTYVFSTKSYYKRFWHNSWSWSDARSYCQSLGSDLAIIPNSETFGLLKPLITGETWVGGRKIDNTWQWIDETPFNLTSNWMPERPHSEDYIDALGINIDGFFNAMPSFLRPTLCQFRFSSNENCK